MATVKCDFRCDLTKPIKVEYLDGNIFTMDNGGNTINVYCYEGEEPATLGGSVSANVIRPDGTTVTVSGAIDGNKAYVTLQQAAYAVPGHVTIIIKVTQGTTVTTIAAIVANNMLSSTDTIVDPGTIIPSVQALIAQIETAVGSIPADYSALLATLAADYSSSKTYAVGDYAWQAGVLKRCIVPITTAETYTAAHWTNAVLGDDLSALKSAFAQYTGVTENLIASEYEKGSINGTNGENTDYRKNARARTINRETALFDFSVEVFNDAGSTTDFYCNVYLFENDTVTDAGAIHEGSSYVVKKGQIYRFLIGDTTRQASASVISLDELLAHVKIKSIFGNVFPEAISADVGKIVKVKTVENDTVTEYEYAKSVDTTLTENGVAADAKATGDTIDVERNKIITINSASGLEWSNGYYDENGGSHGSSTGAFKLSNALPCWEGESMSVCGLTDSANIGTITFFDASGNYKSSLSNIGESGTEIAFTVPNGAYSFRISTSKGWLDKTYVRYNTAWRHPLYLIRKQTLTNGAEISGIKLSMGVAYVDGTNGADTNDGAASAPFATIGKALSDGYVNIKIAPGIYSDALTFSNKNNVSVHLWDTTDAFDTNKPDRDKAVIFRGDALEITSVSDGEYTASYTPVDTSDFYKVFVSKTLNPIASGTYATEYNANAFLYKSGFESVRLMPVLPESYTAQEGTFTFDNGIIRFKPFSRDIPNLSGVKLYVPRAINYGVNFTDINNAELSGVVVLGAYFANFRFQNCSKVNLIGCDSMCATHGSGFNIGASDVDFENCRGIGNQTDGFGLSRYGESKMINCDGKYNGDDGCSHHHGCVGSIVGGVFVGNGSGGITPAFGAIVQINNAFCKGNKYGIALFDASGYQKRTLYISGCTIVDNTSADIYNDGHIGVFSNCIYGTKSESGGAQDIFYPQS